MIGLSNHCVVLCDYPIKTMGYLKMLAALGETNVIALSTPPCPTHNEAHMAKVLIVDMNWITDDEEIAIEYLLEKFPHAQVLFMKEEQNKLNIQTHNGRTIHLLGKLAELDISRHCLRELLAKTPHRRLQTNKPEISHNH